MVAFVASPFFTAISNPDGLWAGPRLLPGITFYDALSDLARNLLGLIPFMVGYNYLGNRNAHKDILKILVASGLAYSILILFEFRMSPQLNVWVYGYFPSSWLQTYRDGGFRPVVFLGHGLVVAYFAMAATISAAILWRASKSTLRNARSGENAEANAYSKATPYLAMVLLLCKSAASIIYGCFLLSAVLLVRPRTQIGIAVILALFAITYPVSRGAGLVPLDTMLSMARSISEAREASLSTRFFHEENLLEKAQERPLLGWGGWGRSRVFDPETGADISITDGYWVIVIGVYGWMGFLAHFGLLGLPILATFRRVRRERNDPDVLASGLCLLLAINMIELLPNSTLLPWTWLIAGALLGRAEQERPHTGDDTPQQSATKRTHRTVL